MNPFTAVLQASHSALIDELCERHPEPKPVLGLPMRQAHWSAPVPAVTQAFTALFDFGKESPLEGILALAATAQIQSALGVTLPELAPRWMSRCGTEFHRHSVRPAMRPFEWEKFSQESINAELQRVTRLIWMPITVGSESIYLGIGARAPR